MTPTRIRELCEAALIDEGALAIRATAFSDKTLRRLNDIDEDRDTREPQLARMLLRVLPILELLRRPHDTGACERPDGPCYTCGKLAEFDAAMKGDE